jgi:hypothetical protein
MTWSVSLRIRGASDQEGQRVQKLAGARQRISLGEYPTISLALAREQVTVLRRLARAGKDPRGSVARPKEETTIRQLIAKFAADLSNREVRSAKNIEELLQLHPLPVWGARGIASIGRGELVELLDQVRVRRKVKRTTPSGRTTQVWRGAQVRQQNFGGGLVHCFSTRSILSSLQQTRSTGFATARGSAVDRAYCQWKNCARSGNAPRVSNIRSGRTFCS